MAASSSAAANSARSARSTARRVRCPRCHCALIQLRACTPPEPLVWKSSSSYFPPVTSKLKTPPGPAAGVVAGEQRHDHEPLHRRGEVRAHEQRELVGLAVERQPLALDLLVVLELGLEEAHHLHRRPGGAGDRDPGVVVGREDLLDAAARDREARGRPPVTGEHHAPDVPDGHDGGAVGDLGRQGTGAARRAAPAQARPSAAAGRRTTTRDRPRREERERRFVHVADQPTCGSQAARSARARSRITRVAAGSLCPTYAIASASRSMSSPNWPSPPLQRKHSSPRMRLSHDRGRHGGTCPLGHVTADRAPPPCASSDRVVLGERETESALQVTFTDLAAPSRVALRRYAFTRSLFSCCHRFT